MGHKQNQRFQLSFNPSLRIDFQGSRGTSDGGLLLVRVLDERLGVSAVIAKNIFRPCWFGSRTVGGDQMKTVSQYREQADEDIIGAIFEVKKEIPANLNIMLVVNNNHHG
jgi:hypothetical protein